ncbi:hypothetical protein HU200_061726 [Digitaria exilis]|uniref:Non-specific lipid-transfer protein n=1 Tax=Digitaria exilis TaxID=1010633 RepID=A0A835E1A8_9POAL|nr:hypothetical protein HU200_061726 [Digitaria exilis]
MARAQLVSMAVVAAVVMLAAAVASSDASITTCADVTSTMAACFDYARGSGGPITGQCCYSLRSLVSDTTTTADKRFACNYLKSAAARVTGLNRAAADKIPARCTVKIPYTISASNDCSR